MHCFEGCVMIAQCVLTLLLICYNSCRTACQTLVTLVQHAAQQTLRKRKLAGERLHQHCRACFRQLKQTSSRPACSAITEPSLALQVSHEQNPKVAAADAKSFMQMDMQPPSQRAAVQPQPRPVSPVRGMLHSGLP